MGFSLRVYAVPHRERQAEILADERVVAARAAGRGGRVRTPQETAAAASITLVGDGRADASSTNGAAPFNSASNGNGRAPVPNVESNQVDTFSCPVYSSYQRVAAARRVPLRAANCATGLWSSKNTTGGLMQAAG